MKRIKVVFLVGLSLLFLGCKSKKGVSDNESKVIHDMQSIDDQIITFKFVQLNDVYEIAPLSGGKYGGMARVAHVRDSIQQENPNTYMFMGGDFLNPSLLGTIKYNGERIRGKQMIEVMNAMDFSLVTFGNHEFDISKEDLQKRLNESKFAWVSSNVKQGDGQSPFQKISASGSSAIPNEYIIEMKDADGTELKVGFFGVTIDSNPQDFVAYADPIEEAKKAHLTLKDQTDLVFGLTHLKIKDDVALVNSIPEVPFIMGGHEHNHMRVPTDNGVVTKADANAKTIYIHTLSYNKKTDHLTIDSFLMPIDDTVSEKKEIKAIVDRWNAILDIKIKEVVAQPNEVIYYASSPLDGTDSASRGVQTNLGNIITHAMANSFNTQMDAAIVNGGSIRLDDVLDGEITSIDIFRVLPFGGGVVYTDITGSLLKEVLDFGKSKGGTGAYLQRYNIEESKTGGWLIEGNPLDMGKTYKIAMSDFLLKGFDIPFLSPQNKGILKVHEPTKDMPAYDIRKAVILYLKSIK